MKIQRSIIKGRTLEVVKLVAEGLTSFEIGQRMDIKENTVNSHRQTAMRLLRVNNAKDLVKVAIQEGLLTIDKK